VCVVHLAESVDAEQVAGLVVLPVAGDVDLEIALYFEIGRDFENDCHVDIGHQERDEMDEDVANSDLPDAPGSAGDPFAPHTDLTLLDSSDMDHARTAVHTLGTVLGYIPMIVEDETAVPCSHVAHRAVGALGLFLGHHLHETVPIVTSLGVPAVGAHCLVADPVDTGKHGRRGSLEFAGIPLVTGDDSQDHRAPAQREYFARIRQLHCDHAHR
jgi:hypothetical protein